MQDGRSLQALPGRHRPWLAAALGAACAVGCATGIDVTDGELAEICSEPGTRCSGLASAGGSAGNAPGGSGGSATGSVGGSTSGGSGAGLGGSSSSMPGGLGGSSNGASGGSATGGTGGTGGGAPQQLAEGDCLSQSDVVILYRDRSNGASTTNEPTMVLSVQNTGPSFDLSDLTIRYWFTADGGGAFSANVDYATLDGQQSLSGAVQVTFAEELGSSYAQLAFTDTGEVDADGVREVQLRFHADGYPDLDQTNDFSFLLGATAATPNPNITPYVSGEQVGGCVPGL